MKSLEKASYSTGVDLRETTVAIEAARAIPAGVAQEAEVAARAARQRADDLLVLAQALECFMDAPTTIHADRQALSEAFQRLLGNQQ